MLSSFPSNRSESLIQVAIANDHPIFKDGFSSMFRMIDQIKIVGEANTKKEFIDLVEEKQPDVVIIDIDIPGIDAVTTTKIIRQKFPEVEVIAFSMYANESLVFDMLEAGAKGYLLKKTSKNEIITAIETVKEKDIYYCKSISNKLVKLIARRNIDTSRQGRKSQLNEKELQIIRLMCQEYCSKEIANTLNINSRSVESSRKNILEKTGAKNMVGIALYAIRNRIFIVDQQEL